MNDTEKFFNALRFGIVSSALEYARQEEHLVEWLERRQLEEARSLVEGV